MSDRMSRGAMSRDSSRKLIFGTGKSGQRRASMPNGGSLRTVKQGEAMNETASDDVMAMARLSLLESTRESHAHVYRRADRDSQRSSVNALSFLSDEKTIEDLMSFDIMSVVTERDSLLHAERSFATEPVIILNTTGRVFGATRHMCR